MCLNKKKEDVIYEAMYGCWCCYQAAVETVEYLVHLIGGNCAAAVGDGDELYKPLRLVDELVGVYRNLPFVGGVLDGIREGKEEETVKKLSSAIEQFSRII